MTRFSTSTDPRFLSRRAILGGGAGLVVLSIAGCNGGPAAPDADGSDYSVPGPDRPKESPMLTEQVEAGELPPLEERLPVEADRLVIDPPEYGVYGGTYRGVSRGEGDHPWLVRTAGFEPALRPSPDLSVDGQPGVLKEIEVNDDGTVYTLHLREGMRWSDGEPVTADDVMFAIEDVYFNETLYANPVELLSLDGERCTAERVDDITVRLTYPGPKGNVIDIASRSITDGGYLFFFPKHYMQDFLPHLNDDAESLAEEAGFSDWTSYWANRNEWYNNPDKPVLHAWVIVTPLNEGGVTVLERNPYYWKVDDDGAQLPYIDRMEFEVVQEDEVMLLKAISGEIDFHSRHFNNDRNRPVLADGREEGNYDFVPMESSHSNRMIISLNLNHQDEVLREIFGTKEFRVGLSHAIDRQEIIDTVYQRQGQPWQAAPRPDSVFFDEELATQYTEFDLDLANQYLDEAGYTERDSAGFRLRPDGDRIRFDVDITPDQPQWATAMDMITGYWEQVGIDARVNSIERTLFYDRKAPSANEHDAAVWWGEGGLHEEMIEVRYWFPSTDESNYATRWANWYGTRGQGEFAEEPPEQTRRQMELQRQILVEPDPDERERLFREVLTITKEQFYTIGIVLPEAGYAIKKNDLRGVAESFYDVLAWSAPAYTNTSLWFFDR